MSKRNISKSYREAMVRVLGTKCRNCGSEENIEYHHVVPLKSTKYSAQTLNEMFMVSWLLMKFIK